MANPITQIILTAVDKTKAAFASVSAGMSALASSASSISGIFGSLFAGFSALKVIGGLKGVIDSMDAVYNSAQKIGTSTENFSGLAYAAGQADIPVEDLEKSLLKLSKTLDDARSGTGAAAEAFQRLKIDPRQFSDPAEALLEIAERFAQMPDGVNKAALAIQLFGRSGAQLIPFLNEGRAGIKALTDEAARLGVVLDGDAAKAADQFNDSLDKLSKAGKGLGVSIANGILPGLNEVTRLMAEAAQKGGLTAAAMEAIKFAGQDFLTNEQLSATYRLMKAQEQLADLRADGFAEDQKRVAQLKAYIPLIQVLADQEKAVEEARREDSKQSSDEIGENRKAEADAYKKSTTEKIADAERLKSALQSAFSASIKAEEDYLRQAKRLRAEANGTGEVGDDPESQARARLDAIAAAMRLQRTASSESLESVQEQADATRELAGNLTDAALKADLLKQANLAEAAALERAAAAERERVQGLAAQMQETQRQADNMKAALEGIGKEVSVEIKPGTQMQQTIDGLREVAHLIDLIKSKGPVVPTGGLDTQKLASGIADLQTAALQYGRR